MGANFAHDLANEDFGLSLEQAVTIHLTANHYPAVPTIMVPVCVQAITCADGGAWDDLVTLPDGVSYRDSNKAPAYAIIEAYHLGAFLSDDEDYNDYGCGKWGCQECYPDAE
jgi:hypothetical protein